MHTVYCDGSNTPEEMVEAAIEKGLDTVGISGHSYTWFDTSYCIQREDIPRYIAEVNYLKAAYFGRIHVLCGVEQDYCGDCPTDAFDYVIGSVHYLRFGEEYVPVDESADILRAACEKYCGGDIYALCEKYFAAVADVANRTGCDIIGHFDLITKFNEKENLFDENHPRYIAAWQKAAEALLQAGVPFEINTGAISRGWRTTPYPSAAIRAYIRQHGGELIPSSDAHSKENVAYAFEKVEALTEPSP